MTYLPKLLAVQLLVVASSPSGIFTVIDINPQRDGSCPGTLQLQDASGIKVCSRSTSPATALTVDVMAGMVQNANIKGLRKYARITGTLKAYQSGGMEAFATGLRDSSSIDSSDYVDGLSLTKGSPRQHVITLAVSLTYDQDLFMTGMCPCPVGSSTRTLYCGGTAAPSWLPLSELVCDSGTLGSPAAGWRPREMLVTFDSIFTLSTDSLEIRLMSDQGIANEDIGIAELTINVHEAQDLVAPVLTLLGPAMMYLSVGDIYVESGAECVDIIDGVVTPTINGTIDTSAAGIGTHKLLYICEDIRENVAIAERTVIVRDDILPDVLITGETQQCVVRGRVYVEYGAICSDNVDGISTANISGHVDTNTVGIYPMLYTCFDFAGNNATALRNVLVITDILPGKIVVESLELQTSRSGNMTVTGSRITISNVIPSSDIRLYWSKNISLNAEGCRYLSLQELTGAGWQSVQRYESKLLGASESISSSDPQMLIISQGLNATFSATLRDLTKYRIAVDEHFLQERLDIIMDKTVGNTSEEYNLPGDGSLRQYLHFVTGDYSGPLVVKSEPQPEMLSWPKALGIILTFNEVVQSGSDSAFLNVRNTETGELKSLPCNGSEGLTIMINALQPTFVPHIMLKGKQATLAMDTWPGWQACSDYQVDVDQGCFADTSVNANPSVSFVGYRFVTSCVVGFSPEPGSLNVPAASTVVLTFADNVQAGSGEFYLTSPSEEVFALNASNYPVVFINNDSVTVDLACHTKTCALNAVRYPEVFAGFNTSDGLCTNRDLSRCRGNPLRVQIGVGAFKRVDGHWPATSLLNGTDILPAQLEEDEYSFVVRPFDLTPPKFESVYAAAMSDTSIRATVRIDESGTIYCAALGGTDGDPCSSVSVIRDDSNSRCSNATYPDLECDGCESPGYGCFNKTAIWTDDGCAGQFMVDGVIVDCGSRLSDFSLYDGGGRSILDLGWRHACAVRKAEEDVSCWGDPNGIDPVTNMPLPGKFLSVSSGYQHTCGVAQDTKQVYCWGLDLFGETSPPNLPGVTYKAVTSGHRFSCALREDNGQAVCWGQNDKGQATPPAGLSFWAISAGHLHVCGIVTTRNLLDSRIECWGSNLEGQSSPPAGPFMSTTPESTLLYEATISAGEYHTCAIRADTATVECWGSDSDGQSTVPDLTGVPIIEVAAGYTHTCVVHKALPGENEVKGTVQCWGSNDWLQATPPAGQKFVDIDAGASYTCGLTLDETLMCWGINFQQQAEPPSGTFGVLDQYSNASCPLDTNPTRERISGPFDTWDAGASSSVAYSAALGYAEVELPLTGLRQNTTYQVYCYAEDDELPARNVVTNPQMVSTHHVVTTLDRAPASMQVLQIYSLTDDTVTIIVRLSEPGVVYCTAVRDREPPPTIREIPAFGSYNATTDDLLATVVIERLARDTEYDTYCTCHDNASWNQDAKRLNNWATYEAVLNTKRDIHTLYDTTPPTITGVLPLNGDFAVCRMGNVYGGCATKVSLTFSEDIQRAEGNVTFTCMSNFAICSDVVIPMESPFFELGTTFIENKRLDFNFDKPLADMTTYKVVISSGAVQDMRGNHFALDVQCPFWFDPAWQKFLGPCTPVYQIRTPS